MLGTILVAALALPARPAEIVKPGEEAAYAAWLEGEVKAAAGTYAGKDCSSAQVSSLSGARLEDVALKARPDLFVYTEMTGVTGCGVADVQQLLVMRDGAGWKAARLAPGRTLAGPTLQKDVLRGVVMSTAAQSRIANPTCQTGDLQKTVQISDTSVIGSYVKGQAWAEHWTVRACGREYVSNVSLTPAADGGVDYRVTIPKP